MSDNVVTLPNNMLDKCFLAQARVVAESIKKAIGAKRYQSFLAKPQHGVFFRQLKDLEGTSSISNRLVYLPSPVGFFPVLYG